MALRPSDTVPVISLPDSVPQKLASRVSNIISTFKAKYNGNKPLYIVRVPGRVNLIGEHIDYCGYAVFPMATQQDIMMAFSVNDDRMINLSNLAPDYPDNSCSCDDIQFPLPPKWYHYFYCGYRGIVEKYCDGPKSWPGVNVLVHGDLPESSGLSSSSAMVCCGAFVTVMAYLYNTDSTSKPLSKLEMATLCAKVEHYIGTDSGGMDQAIAILADEGSAKIIEFIPKLSATSVKLPSGANFYISHSGVSMNKAATAYYNTRVAETRLAAAIIAKKTKISGYKLGDQLWVVQQSCGKSLTEMAPFLSQIFDITKPFYTKAEIATILGLSEEEIDHQFLTKVREPINEFYLYHRALHVYEEASRVHQFRKVCETSADITILGQLMSESHLSCKDNYDCSHPKLDELIEVAMCSGSVGSRLTGAGWGGCIVSLVPEDKSQQFESAMSKFSKFNCKSGPSGGAVIYRL